MHSLWKYASQRVGSLKQYLSFSFFCMLFGNYYNRGCIKKLKYLR